MKFESGRVIQTSADLGNARFAAPDSLDRGLDSIVQRFQSFGWQAVRREVGGARTRGRIPLVVARPTVTSSAPVRVIFQARLGELGSKRASAAAEHSGPAFLLELARSWPVSRSQRIETICVAAGAPKLGQAAARELLSLVQREWADKPTLLVVVHRPGIGPELLIGGRRMRPLAEAAARDLWIPHRTVASNPFSAFPFSWPFQDSLEDYVAVLSGEHSGANDVQLDAGALDRAAQLCTEIALRWARQHQDPRSPEEDRTASRSSQNTG